MKLLTQAQRAQLLDNGRRQAAVKGTPAEIDFKPVVKLFDPFGAATWLLTEIDPSDTDVAFGLCDLGMQCPEIGSVSLSELEGFRRVLTINGKRTSGLLGIERDLHFVADKTLSAYADEARRDGRILA
jgi:hypothetical protein